VEEGKQKGSLVGALPPLGFPRGSGAGSPAASLWLAPSPPRSLPGAGGLGERGARWPWAQGNPYAGKQAVWALVGACLPAEGPGCPPEALPWQAGPSASTARPRLPLPRDTCGRPLRGWRGFFFL